MTVVIPAKAGIQCVHPAQYASLLRPTWAFQTKAPAQ